MSTLSSRCWRLALLACCVGACSACFEQVSDEEHRQLQALRAGTHDVVLKNERVGRFQHFENGTRTWRFDTATGAICILLTSNLDWDDEGIKKQACFK